MMSKISMRMEELEGKVVNGSHNIGGPLNQVRNVFRREEQDARMASETEGRATHDEARTSNMGRLNSNSLEIAHEVKALSNNTNNRGQPVLTREDVNMGVQPNRDSQIHELDQAKLVFEGEDINMGLQPMNNNNTHEQAQAPEVDMSGQTMDTGRSEDVRWGERHKRRKRPLDEDEEDFGFNVEFGLDDDDDDDDDEDEHRGVNDHSDPEMVSIDHILENRVIWLTV